MSPKSAQKSLPPPPERLRLTAREVCQRLGCSIGTVQKFEREGLLHGERTRDEKRQRVRLHFDANEVEALARTWVPQRTTPTKLDNELAKMAVRGRAAAMCYPLFIQKMPLVQVVVATSIDPTLVRQLRKEFDTTYEQGKRLERQEKELEQERRAQEAYDRREERQRNRKHRLELAKLESQGLGPPRRSFFAT